MVILGSTGSIGVNTLNIAREFNLKVEVLAAGRNINLLNEQIKEFNPKTVVVASKDDIEKVNHSNVQHGENALENAVLDSKSELVVNALVGFLGLRPTLATLKSGKKLALANKESLVVGGAFLDCSNIIPIDSEHFGLWYLKQNRAIEKMIITASGGAFRDWSLEKMKNATLEDALKHPNWSMGQKITIDSATMMNKLFELLEARWLFKDVKNFDAIIEPKSIIHALIDFTDGSTTAHLAHADMRLPIAYALLGKVDKPILKSVDLVKIGSLEFREIEKSRYPIWELKDALMQKPELGAIINAANEAAIEQFEDGIIGFNDISKTVIKSFEYFSNIKVENIEHIFEIDKEIRRYAKS